jgi:hypothetical protein
MGKEAEEVVRRWYLLCAMNLANQSEGETRMWKAVTKEQRMRPTGFWYYYWVD